MGAEENGADCEIYELMSNFTLHHGDALEVLRGMPDNSIDAVVTDPPYGFAFMGKKWDYDLPSVEIWAEVLRVAKPGAHLLAFGGARTYHRAVCRIEDAGWEIRDCIQWIYGSGFPKSLNLKGEWEGWGTALKPAHEPVVLARKSLAGAVAANVAAWGCGALNVDGCRVGFENGERESLYRPMTENKSIGWKNTSKAMGYNTPDGLPPSKGRWPANVIHDGSEEVLAGFPMTTSGAMRREVEGYDGHSIFLNGRSGPSNQHGDSGSAARFFYCAKPSRREREAGCDELDRREKKTLNDYVLPSEGRTAPKCGSPARNHHPTVKPIALMRYLCRLVTPPNGIILDPFTGSGTTGAAAMLEGFQFVGVEREAEYIEIARRRIAHWADEREEDAEMPLFAELEGVA